MSRKLLNIKAAAHNVKDLTNFRADLESNLRSLTALGCNVNASSWLIMTILNDKLTSKSLELISLKTKTDYPSVEQFRVALGEVISHWQH